MAKRYFGKITEDNAKQRRWTDGETVMTVVHWKRWANKNGYIGEYDSNSKKFIIFNALTHKTIKTLTKVK